MSEHPVRGVAVIGLGYVGLPLALDLVEAGYRVHGVDRSQQRLEQLAAGSSYVDDVPDQVLGAALQNGHLRLTGIDDDWGAEDAAFVAVPTPLTSRLEPDLSAVLAAARYLRQGLNPGDLVVLQSTTYPGTTMGSFREELEEGGMAAGENFMLAYAPERVSPGDGRAAQSIPRLVGGIDRASVERAAAILGTISPQVVQMSSPEAAELAKLFENVYRNVNIALVNELALICERLALDVWEVLAGAATKPFGFHAFSPGPGVGGHCIPVDPYYLAARAREVGFHERFVETAGDVNIRMPAHVVELTARALNDRGKPIRGSRILVVGVAFKPNVSDSRNSPAGPIMSQLAREGADLLYHDPHLPRFCPEGIEDCQVCLENTDLAVALALQPDCVVVVTNHTGIDWPLIFHDADLIVDTRNVSEGNTVGHRQVLKLGAGWIPATVPRV